MQTRRRQPRGFTLTEMLLALILMGVFALAVSQLFLSLVTLSRNSAESENKSASFEAAVAALRADVWRATKIEQAGEVIKLSIGDETVEWPIDGDAWSDWKVPAGAKLALEKSHVVVRVPASKGTRAVEFWLNNQIGLVEGMTR